jgi:hypothetical protein
MHLAKKAGKDTYKTIEKRTRGDGRYSRRPLRLEGATTTAETRRPTGTYSDRIQAFSSEFVQTGYRTCLFSSEITPTFSPSTDKGRDGRKMEIRERRS